MPPSMRQNNSTQKWLLPILQAVKDLGAEYLSFAYSVPNASDGHFVTVFVDDKPLWTMLATSTGSGFVDSGKLPLCELTGVRKISILLHSLGEKNAVVQFRNIRAFTVSGPQADVSLNVSAPATIASGTPFNAVFKVRNNGPAQATATEFSAAVGSAAALGAVTTTHGNCTTSAELKCDLGALASGAEATITAVLTGLSQKELAITGMARSGVSDPNSSNNNGFVKTTITAGQPRLAGSVSNKGIHSPGVLWVDLKISNTGSSLARNVTVTQILPRVLAGSGTVTMNATLSPPLPLVLGDISVNNSVTRRLYFNLPATVTRFSITENGTLSGVKLARA